jgi:Mg2+/Co2+ transporter CorC
LAGSTRHSILSYFNSTPNGILIGTEIIDNAVNSNSLDMIITCESNSALDEVLLNKLKLNNNTEFISLLQDQYEQNTIDRSQEKNIEVQRELKPADTTVLQKLYFSMLILKSKMHPNKQEAVESVIAFINNAGLKKLPLFNVTTARKYEIDQILRSKDLLGAL